MKVVDGLFDDLVKGNMKTTAIAFNYILWLTLVCVSFKSCVSDFDVLSIKKLDEIIAYMLKGGYLIFAQWLFLVFISYILIRMVLTNVIPLFAKMQLFVFTIIDKRHSVSYLDFYRRGENARKDHIKVVERAINHYGDKEIKNGIEVLNLGIAIFLKLLLLSIISLKSNYLLIKPIAFATIGLSFLIVIVLEMCLIYGLGIKRIRYITGHI